MNKILSIVCFIVGALVGYAIGNVLAGEYLDILTQTGGMITASEIIEVQIIPFTIALLVGLGAYFLMKNK